LVFVRFPSSALNLTPPEEVRLLNQRLFGSNLHIYQRARAFREEHTTYVDTYDEFKQVLTDKGGFIYAHWDGTAATEQAIKEETKATIRLIPLDAPEESGTCIYSGKPSRRRVVFAVAY